MNWTDPLFLSSGITGVSLLIAAFISERFPAKEINDLYGYRSERSKSSQAARDFSQKYATGLMYWVALYNCLVAVPGLFISLHVGWAITLSMTVLLASCGYLFWDTERELKKRFSE